MKCPHCTIAFDGQAGDTTLAERADSLPGREWVYCPHCLHSVILLREGLSAFAFLSDDDANRDAIWKSYLTYAKRASLTPVVLVCGYLAAAIVFVFRAHDTALWLAPYLGGFELPTPVCWAIGTIFWVLVLRTAHAALNALELHETRTVYSHGFTAGEEYAVTKFWPEEPSTENPSVARGGAPSCYDPSRAPRGKEDEKCPESKTRLKKSALTAEGGWLTRAACRRAAPTSWAAPSGLS